MREKEMVGKHGGVLYKACKPEHNTSARNTEACKTEDVFCLQAIVCRQLDWDTRNWELDTMVSDWKDEKQCKAREVSKKT